MWKAGLATGAMAWAGLVALVLARSTPGERPIVVALLALVAPLGAAALGMGFVLLDRDGMPRTLRFGGRFLCAALISPMALALMILGRAKREPAP